MFYMFQASNKQIQGEGFPVPCVTQFFRISMISSRVGGKPGIPGFVDLKQRRSGVNMHLLSLIMFLLWNVKRNRLQNMTSFFQVTLWSPKWRSLNPLKGHLNPPKGSLGRTWDIIFLRNAVDGSWNITYPTCLWISLVARISSQVGQWKKLFFLGYIEDYTT